MSRTGSEPKLAGYVKRIVPRALWYIFLAVLGGILSYLPRLSPVLKDAGTFLNFAVFALVIGFGAAALEDAWSRASRK